MTGSVLEHLPCRRSAYRNQKMQSKSRFLRIAMDVKSWSSDLPSVEAVRPGQCFGCGVASRQLGRGLQLHGHGLRSRQLWGPPGPGGAAVTAEVSLRRYVCCACGAVTTVGPRGLVPWHRYTTAAIVLALWLWTHLRLPPARVRARVSPWSRCGVACTDRWASLQRWSRRLREGRLWSCLSALPTDMSLRDCAHRGVQAALAHAAPGLEGEAAVMLGGAHLA